MPGPVSFARNSASAPKSMFLMPFTRSISNGMFASNRPTWPGCTFSTSPGPSSYSTTSPSSSIQAWPVPDTRCRMKPSPPKNPALSFCWNPISSDTLGVPHR